MGFRRVSGLEGGQRPGSGSKAEGAQQREEGCTCSEHTDPFRVGIHIPVCVANTEDQKTRMTRPGSRGVSGMERGFESESVAQKRSYRYSLYSQIRASPLVTLGTSQLLSGPQFLRMHNEHNNMPTSRIVRGLSEPAQSLSLIRKGYCKAGGVGSC